MCILTKCVTVCYTKKKRWCEMSGTSTKTELVTMRVSNDAMKVARRRCLMSGKPLRGYLADILERDLLRSRKK